MSDSTYAQDLALLGRHTEVVELATSPEARVIVAPLYQGRVMTSTLAGEGGASFGWLNAPFIESDVHDHPGFNNYGGEDRFWLGPEAGQFGLWFQLGDTMDVAHAKTPPGFGHGAFSVTRRDSGSVAMAKSFEVSNYAGTTFHCSVDRTITVLDADRAAKDLGAAPPAGVSTVGFESANVLTNAGKEAWSQAGGLTSIWILGQFKASPACWVVVPLRRGDEARLGPLANTTYFGAVPADRCTVAEDYVTFKADGVYRSKIGVSPARAKNVLGSYDPGAGVLTIVQFNLPKAAAKLPYVNSMWEMQKKPFAGDAINSYNDLGARTSAGLAPTFYELETSSPAAALKPGESVTHIQRTYHFGGEKQALAKLAKKILGVELNRIA
jgi:hypothetical protein